MTQQRSSQDAQAKPERYRELFELAPDAYVVTDAHGVVREANRAAHVLLGDHPIGTAFDARIAADQRLSFQARLGDLQAGRAEQLKEWVVSYARPDDKSVEISLTANVRRDSAGQVVEVRWLLRDATQRKRVADMLYDVAARARAIVETAVDAIITIDAHGIIQSFNTAAERMFGYRADEVVGQNVNLLMPAPDRERHDEYVTRYLRTGEKRIIGIGREVVGLHRNGRMFPIGLAVSETRLRDGPLFTGIVRDISERKRHEQRQAAQYAVTHALAESATVVEAIPRLLRAICECGGWHVGEMWQVDRESQRLRWCGMWHDPSLGAAAAFADSSRSWAFARGDGVPGQVWASGRACWLTDIAAQESFVRLPVAHRLGLRAALGLPIRQAGAVTGVLLFFSTEEREPDHDLLDLLESLGSQIGDFVARKRSEEALEQSKDRYRRLVDLSPDAILVNKDGRIAFVNNVGVRLFGAHGVDELLGRPVLDLFHRNYHAAIEQRIQQLLHGSGAVPFIEERIVRLDGKPVDVEVAAATFSDDGGPAIQVVLRDITERKRAAAQLLELEQLAQQRERLADIGAITAQIVHDLGNPLAAVSMHAQLILRRAQRSSDQPLSSILKPADRIVAEVHRLGALIKEFMEFSREQRLDLKPVNLGRFLASVVELWRPLASARAIDLALSVPADIPTVVADDEKLHRVFENLIKNAVEAIEQGPGRVEIAASVLDEERVRVSVADTGPGVSESVEVFRLFETTKPQGSGLGLAIVKQLVSAHRGGIGFAAARPHGAIFHVDLRIRGPFG
ncbi:MAG TPA: PAS domain S-box protein [Candidatus Binatia bacterium]|nr:PAS domain S-box protein [Candidatus Binatia bacterium]